MEKESGWIQGQGAAIERPSSEEKQAKITVFTAIYGGWKTQKWWGSIKTNLPPAIRWHSSQSHNKNDKVKHCGRGPSWCQSCVPQRRHHPQLEKKKLQILRRKEGSALHRRIKNKVREHRVKLILTRKETKIDEDGIWYGKRRPATTKKKDQAGSGRDFGSLCDAFHRICCLFI